MPSERMIRLDHLPRHQIVLLYLALSMQPGRQTISPHLPPLQHSLKISIPTIMPATMSTAVLGE
jgi:hypothetical protein